MRILLTNDDGYHAEGLRALRAAAREFGDTYVVAPEREQSGASHALTLSRPLRLRVHADQVFSVDGTPTDCVLLAVRGIAGQFPGAPDLILSGVNHGANLGDDVTYSGTVAAAMEGSLFQIPSIAFSLDQRGGPGFAEATITIRNLLEQLLRVTPRPGLLLNVNLPDRAHEQVRGVRVARLGRRFYPESVEERHDPAGRAYYWIGGGSAVWTEEADTDFAAVQAGYVSLTPLHMDLTDYRRMDEVAAWTQRTDGA